MQSPPTPEPDADHPTPPTTQAEAEAQIDRLIRDRKEALDALADL